MFFKDRQEAGRLLARQLDIYKGHDTVVLGLPRGGVVVASKVAKYLKVPFDVLVVRKISLPLFPEFGVGAIAQGGIKTFDTYMIAQLGVSKERLDKSVKRESEELKRRVAVYRGKRKMPNLTGKTVILVDDGLATGVTAQAAVKAVRKYKPGKVVLAVPVCALETFAALKRQVDNIVCLHTPSNFSSVGAWYQNFEQVSDKEVVKILKS